MRRVCHDFFHGVSITETESWVLAKLSWNKTSVAVCSGYAVTVCVGGGGHKTWLNLKTHTVSKTGQQKYHVWLRLVRQSLTVRLSVRLQQMSYSVQSVHSECVCQTGTNKRIQRGSEKFSKMRHSSNLEDKEIIIGSYWRVGRESLERFSLVIWWSLQLCRHDSYWPLCKVHACSCRGVFHTGFAECWANPVPASQNRGFWSRSQPSGLAPRAVIVCFGTKPVAGSANVNFSFTRTREKIYGEGG